VVALALLLLPLAAVGGTGSTGTVIRAPGNLTLATDGARIAYDGYVTAQHCYKVFVAELPSGTARPVSRCLSEISTTRYLALAGPRTAWIDEQGDPSGYDRDLWVASATGKPRRLASSSCDGDLDTGEPCVGTWITNIVGSGGVLAVNRGVTNDRGVDTRSDLDLLGSRSLRKIASGAKAIYAQAADAGRIAVLRPSGTIGVYSAAGKLLLQVTPSSVADQELAGAVALGGKYLLVLTTAKTLEVYNAHSGRRLHSLPVRKGATNLTVGQGLAAYAEYPPGPSAVGTPYKVHVVRLATGKDVVLGTGTYFTGQRDVALGPAGLVYLKDPRTLVFVPLSRVRAAASR
jgi:hypothetical protein